MLASNQLVDQLVAYPVLERVIMDEFVRVPLDKAIELMCVAYTDMLRHPP